MNEPPSNSAAPAAREKPDYSQLEYIPAFVPQAEPARPAAERARPAVPKIDWNAVPMIELIDAAAQERVEQETTRRRWDEIWGLVKTLGLIAGLIAFLVLAVRAVQFFGNDRPGAEPLAAAASQVGAEVLRRYQTPGQPLAVRSARPELFQITADGRAEYDVVVELELRAALYAPADSNGAQGYLQLQRSLRDAHLQLLERGLFQRRPDLAHPPTLPPLVAVTHRAGEQLLIKVPLEARRSGWSWELTPRFEQRRDGGRRFSGEEISRQPREHLVFGAPGTREEMRRLMNEAQRYIIAVKAALAQ